ncbi:MAG: choice-of-anchor B family protein [Bacteroidota bacterium]
MKYIIPLLLCLNATVLTAQSAVNFRLLDQWQDTSIQAGANWVGNVYNEVWGWHDDRNGKEYAFIGSSVGLHAFEITSNNRLREVGFYRGRAQGVIHRDFKNKGKYLYAVSDQFEGSLQIFDMSSLPDSLHKVYDSDEFFQRSHNVWIEGNRLYMTTPRFDGDTLLGGMGMLDISNPTDPELVTYYPRSQFGRLHDFYSRNDTVYLHSENDGMYIVDFKDSLNPQVLVHLDAYPSQGYNHSGWLSDDGKTYVFADENHDTPLKVLDVTDPTDPEFISFLWPEMPAPRPAHSLAHNQVWLDQYLFSSYYYEGVVVFDLSDPENPVVAGSFDTFTGQSRIFYEGGWGVYPLLPSRRILVSDMSSGLFLLEFTPMPLSVEFSANTDIQIYPNPFSHTLSINLPEDLTQPRIEIHDLQGKLLEVYAEIPQENEFRFHALAQQPTGVYFLSVWEGNTRITTEKVVKQ